MSDDTQQQILTTLREIRDGQRIAIEQLTAQRALVQEQMAWSRQSIETSIGLQRLSVQRQRTLALIALPAILACIAAIAYLVWRYF